MIEHQVESLAAAGVTDIVLAVNYRPDIMVAALKKVSFYPEQKKKKREPIPPPPKKREKVDEKRAVRG